MTNSSQILVVDDTPTNLEIISETLLDAGYKVSVALNGERALKRVQNHPPDLILLDVRMPGIDGFETCKRLKSNPETAKIPIIFITAFSDTENKVKGFNLGGVDYITKPIQAQEMLARVRTHLQLKSLNQSLEKQVAERTSKLQAALEQLQQSQLQLVQTEKMSALGNLVAGLAHEINNPINFIHGNLPHVQDHTGNLLHLLKLYQEHYPAPEPNLQAAAAELDLEFIQADLPKVLSSIKLGTERIRQIVSSLRNFSRTDEADLKPVDIHKGIDSTLLILQHRLKERPDRSMIHVIRDYDQLPLIECHAGQLNQVFMNILANAIDALEEASAKNSHQKNGKTRGQINIQTSLVDANWVKITISDNGIGMPDEIQNRIFDPFFTTKPIGKGTGLGMPISYQVITENHGGDLVCFSKPDEGTTFAIQIPIRQPIVEQSDSPTKQTLERSSAECLFLGENIIQ